MASLCLNDRAKRGIKAMIALPTARQHPMCAGGCSTGVGLLPSATVVMPVTQVDVRKRQHSGSVWFPYAMFEALRRALDHAQKGAPRLQRSAEQLVAAIERHAALAVKESERLEQASMH